MLASDSRYSVQSPKRRLWGIYAHLNAIFGEDWTRLLSGSWRRLVPQVIEISWKSYDSFRYFVLFDYSWTEMHADSETQCRAR